VEPSLEDDDRRHDSDVAPKGDNPPDGPYQMSEEWREGKDKVIESKSGPGEDIEVAVVKDAYDGSESWERGLARDVKDGLCDIKNKCHLGKGTGNTSYS